MPFRAALAEAHILCSATCKLVSSLYAMFAMFLHSIFYILHVLHFTCCILYAAFYILHSTFCILKHTYYYILLHTIAYYCRLFLDS